jgi:hypothetical protein
MRIRRKENPNIIIHGVETLNDGWARWNEDMFCKEWFDQKHWEGVPEERPWVDVTEGCEVHKPDAGTLVVPTLVGQCQYIHLFVYLQNKRAANRLPSTPWDHRWVKEEVYVIPDPQHKVLCDMQNNEVTLESCKRTRLKVERRDE